MSLQCIYPPDKLAAVDAGCGDLQTCRGPAGHGRWMALKGDMQGEKSTLGILNRDVLSQIYLRAGQVMGLVHN